MKVFLLQPRPGLVKEDDPWMVDGQHGMKTKKTFVIRARNEEEAREMAQQLAGDEAIWDNLIFPWLDSHYSTATYIRDYGQREVIV